MLPYNAEISAGSLLVPESRKLARFTLGNPSESDWHKALVEDNILQKKTPATAKRQARLIRNRLQFLDMPALHLVADRENEIVVQLLFFASLKHSLLLKDFLSRVVMGHVRQLELSLSVRDWDAFMVECGHRDISVENWSASTKEKLLQVILRILAEAKYIDSTRHMRIQRVQLHPEIKGYLNERGERKMVELMELKR